jgi:hypothetical protein
MEFPLVPGGHVVELRWGSTVARTWGGWLSALALLLLVLTPWLRPRGLALLRSDGRGGPARRRHGAPAAWNATSPSPPWGPTTESCRGLVALALQGGHGQAATREATVPEAE